MTIINTKKNEKIKELLILNKSKKKFKLMT